MKRIFRVEKIAIENLLGLLMELYEKGMDFVDLTCDHSDPTHDKLIVMTRDEYINPDAKQQMEENGESIDDVFPEHKPENKEKFRKEHPDFPMPHDSGDQDAEGQSPKNEAFEDDEQDPNKFIIKGKKLTDEDLNDLIQ